MGFCHFIGKFGVQTSRCNGSGTVGGSETAHVTRPRHNEGPLPRRLRGHQTGLTRKKQNSEMSNKQTRPTEHGGHEHQVI